MDIVAGIADITGIISFIIGIATFITALRIRNKVLTSVEKQAYVQGVDSDIKDLRSYYETIRKDSVYTAELLDTIDMKLDDLLIAYGTILPKEVVGLINSSKKHIKQFCLKNINDVAAKRELIKKLHTLESKLAKEKKILW